MRKQHTQLSPLLPQFHLVRAMFLLSLVSIAFTGKTVFAAHSAAEATTYTITGTVRDYDGAPMATTVVTFFGNGANFGSVFTDASGRY